MTLEWDSLPLLPLRCVLDHLSTEDALAAMSTCRHWRNTMLLYEGHKETLKLKAKQLEKSLFVSRVFRRHTRKLHIYLDCTDTELDKFMNFVLPLFFDTAKLQELVFIGPSYIHQNQHVPFVKLKRILTEALVFKHMKCLQKLALMGCAINTMQNENDRYIHKHTEYYCRSLTLNSAPTPADTLFSSANAGLMRFSNMKHIVVDYDQINTASLETLSQLSTLQCVTLNITYKRHTLLEPIDWLQLQHVYATPLQVAVNIIAVPYRKFNHIMENVLVEGLNLISFKVLFCKTLYSPLLVQVAQQYSASLREVVWADSPVDSPDPYHRIVRPRRTAQPEGYEPINPFILLCWQCDHLIRLVIHGYWVWQYDLVGFVRLRKTLSHLEISAIYDKQNKYNGALQLSEEGTVRVLANDVPAGVDTDVLVEVNEYVKFKWRPMSWNNLHPALRSRATASHRADYVISEARNSVATI